MTYEVDSSGRRWLRLTVKILVSNYDKMHEVAIGTGDTPADTVNRALAFHHMIITTPPHQVVNWKNSDGSTGRLLILPPHKDRATGRVSAARMEDWGFWWRRLWLCKIRRQHQEKMASRGRCIRCGVQMRESR